VCPRDPKFLWSEWKTERPKIWIVLNCGCTRACPIVVFGEGAPEQIFATRMPNDGRSFM
jgi:hypothetical protein